MQTDTKRHNQTDRRNIWIDRLREIDRQIERDKNTIRNRETYTKIDRQPRRRRVIRSHIYRD